MTIPTLPATPKIPATSTIPCYCCAEKTYSDCCEPIIQARSAATPEALMRSRYSAFCIKNADYLIATASPPTRSPDLASGLESTFQTTDWRGLKIIKAGDDFVEFSAFFSPKNKLEQLDQIHELSYFEHIEGKWYYTKGKHLPPLKLQRNDSCFCGSHKKYKNCCAK